MGRKNTWKTHDGRVVAISDMDDRHLENSIRYLERRGVAAGTLTPEQRAEDLVANAEFLMGGISDFQVEQYKKLLAERQKRASARKLMQAVMAALRPNGEPAQPAPARILTPWIELEQPAANVRLADAVRRMRPR